MTSSTQLMSLEHFPHLSTRRPASQALTTHARPPTDHRKMALLAKILILHLISHLEATLTYETTNMDRAANIPDTLKKTPDFIEKNGYHAETHEIVTEDGYILTLHRIPKLGLSASPPVVFVQHGISGSSDNWVLGGPRSLPFVLSDNGFDVWLGNSRGNSYSKRHINMTTDDPKFWNFSFHEQGYYDLAASIDYALSTSGEKKLFLMGHSRGTTSSFVLLSMRPEYNLKLHLLVCYAPVAYLKHSRSPLLQAFFQNASARQTKSLLAKTTFKAFPGLTNQSIGIRNTVCGKSSATQPMCMRFLDLLMGDNYFMNKTIVDVLFTHFPDGGANREFLHYLQIAQTDRFEMYDLGYKKNYQKYASPNPPQYPLETITAPVSFFYSDNDFIVNPKDLMKLVRRIRNKVGVFRVPHKKFNHVDFVLGKETERILYKQTIALMKSYRF